MSTQSGPTAKTAVNGIRTALGVGGVVSLIVGILILVLPRTMAEVLTAIIAIYAIIGGVTYAALGIFSKTMGGWSRIGHVVLGIVFIVAAIFVFANLGASTVALAALLGIVVGVMWLVEGVVALTTLSDSSSKAWSIFYAIISIVAGIVLLLSPFFGAAILWWLLGISLVVLGILQIVRAFRFGKKA